MQCANCTRPIPVAASVCPFCGQLVAPGSAGESRAGTAQASAQPVVAAQPGMARTGFAFQEFRGASVPPAGYGMPGMAQPFINYTGAQLPVPGQPAPFFPAQGSAAPAYPVLAPYAPQPQQKAGQPTRWWRSMGMIVLYALLAIGLLYVGLGAGLYALGAVVGNNLTAQYNAQQTAAMQLYHQVTDRPPTTDDLLGHANTVAWPDGQNQGGSCTPTSDGYLVSITSANMFEYCSDRSLPLGNFAFQVQMRIMNGDAGGFVFRLEPSTDSSHNSFYLFEIDSEQNYLIAQEQGATGKYTMLTSGTTRAMRSAPGRINLLTVIARGSVFDLYVNQQFIVEFQDATLPTGSLGLEAGDQGNATSVLYSNAELWELS